MYVLLIRFNLKLGFLIFNNMLNDFIDLFFMCLFYVCYWNCLIFFKLIFILNLFIYINCYFLKKFLFIFVVVR